MSENPETGYLEDCCWTWIADHCPKRHQQPCQCRCHLEEKPRPANEQELLLEVQRLRRQREAALDMAQEDRAALAAAEQRAAAAEAERDALRVALETAERVTSTRRRQVAPEERPWMLFCGLCGREVPEDETIDHAPDCPFSALLAGEGRSDDERR